MTSDERRERAEGAGGAPAPPPERRGLGARLAGAFVVLSVIGTLAPMRRYVARLSPDDLVLWAAAIVWVLTLPLVFLLTLRLARSWLTRRRGAQAD